MLAAVKKILIFVFLISVFNLSAGNNLSNRYVMHPRADDLLYFVLPFNIPCMAKGKAANLDITYITSETRCKVNMSIWTSEPLQMDSVVFLSEQSYRADSLTLLFVEKTKNSWWYRLSFQVDFEILSKLYGMAMPYRISVYADDDVLQYAFPARNWPSESRWMSELLRLIVYNRERL